MITIFSLIFLTFAIIVGLALMVGLFVGFASIVMYVGPLAFIIFMGVGVLIMIVGIIYYFCVR